MKISPFETQDALEINEARGTFLKSFLPDLIRKARINTALDAGCGGSGFFSRLLKDLGLEVTGFDVRVENVAEAGRLSPNIDFKICDVEDPSVISLGRFDLVLCFGLLYHLENPFRAIRNLHAITEKYLLIEAQTAPYQSLYSVLYEEPRASNQSLNYVVLMPTESSFVKMLYKAGFATVYRSYHVPEHPEYRGSLTRKKVRTILIASKIENPESIKEWQAAKFCLILEPILPALSLRNWDTNLGKTTHNVIDFVTKPGVTVQRLFNRLIKFVPSSLIVRACRFMSRPLALRLWPGWYTGAGQSTFCASTLIRETLWTGFSYKCLDKTFILPWHNGIKILAYPKVMTCRSLFVTGYYEPNEFCFLKTFLKPGMVFIDIGANIGLYTLFASKLVNNNGTVLAIEPSEREIQRLRENVKLNKSQNIRLRQVAISNSCAKRELLIAEEEHSGHNTFGVFTYAGVQIHQKQPVNTETLDEVVQNELLSRVDAIKIDVEGHELFVLEGAKETLSKFCPILLVEISDGALVHQGCSSLQVLKFLLQLGYRIYLFSRQTGLPVPLNKTIEYFESENILAIHESSEVNFIGNA